MKGKEYIANENVLWIIGSLSYSNESLFKGTNLSIDAFNILSRRDFA